MLVMKHPSRNKAPRLHHLNHPNGTSINHGQTSAQRHPSPSANNTSNDTSLQLQEDLTVNSNVPSMVFDGRKNTIKVSGLVRPFKIPDLKAMLVEVGGEILDFSIDGIMSQCNVVYQTEEIAKAAKEALQDTKWPMSPGAKTLSVEFIDEYVAFPSRMPTVEQLLFNFQTEEHSKLVASGFMYTQVEPKLYFLPRSEDIIAKMRDLRGWDLESKERMQKTSSPSSPGQSPAEDFIRSNMPDHPEGVMATADSDE